MTVDRARVSDALRASGARFALLHGSRADEHAQDGSLLVDDDPSARVAWQADTRLRYLDDAPAMRERYRTRREQLARDRG